MIVFDLDSEVLGNTVFALSPLGEVASSLRVLGQGGPPSIHRPWLSQIRQPRGPVAGYRLDLLLQVLPADSSWMPGFLYPPVRSPGTSIEDQLDVLAMLTGDAVEAGLSPQWSELGPPPRIRELLDRGADAGKDLAEALYLYWQHAVAPFWVRMKGVLEEDIAHRATQSLQHGLFELLRELHPRIRVDGHRLGIDMPGYPDAAYGQARLTLVPSVFVWPGLVLTHEIPGEFEITYGARGTARVWEDLTAKRGEARTLDSLVGASRAAVLQLLGTPRSTTDLANELGQSLAAVSRHLTVLRDSGLATSWRTGRVVLYQQTPFGTSLVALNRRSTPKPSPPWSPRSAGDVERHKSDPD